MLSSQCEGSSLTVAFDAHVAERPDDPFVVTLDRTTTYGEAGTAVSAIRHDLHAAGVRSGDRILMLAHNGPEFVLGWLALAGLDATLVPLHQHLPSAGRATVERQAGATFLVGSARSMRDVGEWSSIDPSRRLPLDGYLERPSGSREHEHEAVAVAEHPCSILYTSGTTGPPKGVVLSHAAYLAAAATMVDGIGLDATDRILTALPLYHANPQFYVVATALVAGASIALLDGFDAATFMDDAARLEATGFTYVGTILAMLARAGGGNRDHPISFCVGGGAPAEHWETLEHRWGMRIHELYGSTETGSFATLNTLDDYRRGSCGRRRPDMEVAIVDEHDAPVPTGQRGEVVIRPSAPSVMFDGYFGRPDLTVARSRNLWFHTGDLGSLDEDGYFYFGGRVDDRIRRGGENIDPRSVERAVAEHPAVREVAVVGIDDDVMGQEVKAVIVADGSFDPSTLPRVLAEQLPRLAWPRYVEVREELPKTATEKVVLSALREAHPSLIDLRAEQRTRRSQTTRPGDDRHGA